MKSKATQISVCHQFLSSPLRLMNLSLPSACPEHPRSPLKQQCVPVSGGKAEGKLGLSPTSRGLEWDEDATFSEEE